MSNVTGLRLKNCGGCQGRARRGLIYTLRNELGQECGKVHLLADNEIVVSGPYVVIRNEYSDTVTANKIDFTPAEVARRKVLGLE